MYTVDASIWVNAFDQREPGHEVSRQFLELVRQRSLPVVVPTMVLAEVAGAISRTHEPPAALLQWREVYRQLGKGEMDESISRQPGP